MLDGADQAQRLWLVQGREHGQILDVADAVFIEAHWAGEHIAPMDHAMADGVNRGYVEMLAEDAESFVHDFV